MMRTEKFLTALPLVALAVGALALITAPSLAGCGAPTPDIDGDAPRDQAVTVGMAPVESAVVQTDPDRPGSIGKEVPK